MRQFTRILFVAVCILLIAGTVSAGEKKLMHCFAFSSVKEATDADWQAFFKATDALPEKIPGLTHVWYGKLARPLTVFQYSAKPMAADNDTATTEVKRLRRDWGVCMEFADDAALKTYAKHPEHDAWGKVYEKVRQYGTTTYDILGQ